MRKSNIGPLVDEFGLLKAQIAALEAKLEPIKKQLGELEAGAYEGDLFRVTVSKYDQDRLDMDAVRAKLSRQFIAANTTTTSVTKIAAKARNNINMAA